MTMPIISLVTNQEGGIVLFKSEAELSRDYAEIVRRISEGWDATWKKIEAEHAAAEATIKPGVPVLAKADTVLKERVERARAHTAALDKILNWLNENNTALAKHSELVERSRRFRERHSRWFA